MKIIIKKPKALNEQGKRANNEDNLYPPAGTANEQQDLFVVCDGVGGSNKGELASKIVSKNFYTLSNEKNFREKLIQNFEHSAVENAINYLLKKVEAKLDSEMQQNAESRGMASTLTYLMLTEQGAIAAWVGDSRIYHFRNGRIINRTQDHSLVAQLIESGQITADEALKHPQKNVILRAISGSENATKADVLLWTDVKAGDYFMLCTDGIMEGFDSEQELEQLFASNDYDRIANQIFQNCGQKSRDNFTMYLLAVDKVLQQESNYAQHFPKQQAQAQDYARAIPKPEYRNETEPQFAQQNEPAYKKLSKLFDVRVLLVAIIIILLAVGGIVVYDHLADGFDKKAKELKRIADKTKDSLENIIKTPPPSDNKGKGKTVVNPPSDDKGKGKTVVNPPSDDKGKKGTLPTDEDINKAVDKVVDIVKKTEDNVDVPTPPVKTEEFTNHVVGDDDTIYSLSKKFEVSEDAIRTANGLGKDDVIVKGKTIKIPKKQ